MTKERGNSAIVLRDCHIMKRLLEKRGYYGGYVFTFPYDKFKEGTISPEDFHCYEKRIDQEQVYCSKTNRLCKLYLNIKKEIDDRINKSRVKKYGQSKE